MNEDAWNRLQGALLDLTASNDIVAWDFDGVLVESWHLFREVVSEIIPSSLDKLVQAPHGLTTTELVGSLLGAGDDSCDRIAEIVNATYEMRAVKDLVPDLLGFQVCSRLLAMGRRNCIVTNGNADFVESLLREWNQLSSFVGILSPSGDVRAKPAPDLLLRALQLFGDGRHTAVLIEDSDIGVQAGCEAGFTTIRLCRESGVFEFACLQNITAVHL